MDIDPTPVLAPSEAVYVTLQAQLSDRELVIAVLKAALLASERAGEIRLSVAERPATEIGEQDSALTVAPAGKAADWPNASPESRLRVTESREVGEVVAEWLQQDSRDPWALAAEKVEIGLAIRGAATVGRRPYSDRRTYVPSNPVRAQAQTDAQPIMDLMQGLLARGVAGDVPPPAKLSWPALCCLVPAIPLRDATPCHPREMAGTRPAMTIHRNGKRASRYSSDPGAFW